jgi:DNA primase
LGAQALATGGAILADQQLKKIKMLGPRKGVILAPDNDIAGLKSLLVNAKLLERAKIKVFYSLPKSIPYTDAEGNSKQTKDFNELYTAIGMSLTEIRKSFDEGIKRFSVQCAVKIRKYINEMGKKG